MIKKRYKQMIKTNEKEATPGKQKGNKNMK